jgi:hypothetical protein
MKIEIFNEFCTIGIGYGLLVLLNETNTFMKDITGIWIVAVLSTNFGVNLIIQMIGFVCNIKNNWRLICQKLRRLRKKPLIIEID